MSRLLLFLLLFAPSAQAAIGLGSVFCCDGTNSYWSTTTLESGLQPSNSALTYISGLADVTFTNVLVGGTNLNVRRSGGTNFVDTTGHLNNWGQIPTGAMANATSTSTLTNWINSFTVGCSNLCYAIGSSCSNLAYAIGTASTNYANSVTNSTIVRQGELTTESNLLWSISVTTKTATTVTGAGNGSTNYLLSISTNGINYFYLGSSNVIIYTVSGSTLGSPILWTAIVSNLSANTWGFTVASGTNRWRFFSPVYGTNRPVTLTNNTALCLNGQSDGTNTLVNYYYFTPGL